MALFTSPQLILTAFLPLSLCAEIDLADTASPIELVGSFLACLMSAFTDSLTGASPSMAMRVL